MSRSELSSPVDLSSHSFFPPFVFFTSHLPRLATMKGFLGVTAALPLLVAASPFVIDSIHKDAAPILSASNAKEIADSYIVVFKDHVQSKHAADHHSWVQDIHLKTQSYRSDLKKKRSQTNSVDEVFGGLKHTYNIPGGLLGYSGHFHEDVIEKIRRHPDVS